MSQNESRQLHALISGRVQGVGFRYFVAQCFGSKKIFGWVRNLHDGRVELLAEGKKDDLEFLLAKVSMGPSSSYVENVAKKWGIASLEYSAFKIAATAPASRRSP